MEKAALITIEKSSGPWEYLNNHSFDSVKLNKELEQKKTQRILR